jgi:hypothetical protein
VYINFDIVPDSQETGIRMWRRIAASRLPEDAIFSNPEDRRRVLAMTLGFRGHVREAADTMLATGSRREDRLFGDLALLGAMPADTVDRVFRSLLNRTPAWPPPSALSYALPWWATRRDSSALKIAIDRFRAHDGPGEKALPRYRVAHLLAAARAYLALARADTADALHRLEALPIRVGRVWPERLTLARLLAARGRAQEAMAVLDAGYPQPWPWPSRALWALERARVAERLGQRDKAGLWYTYVADVWRHADPELHPARAEARLGLARVWGEREPSAGE